MKVRAAVTLLGFGLLMTGCISGGGGTSSSHQEPGEHTPPTTEEVSDAVASGALAYEDWTSTAAGGSGVLPAGETEGAYVRCVSCHGWDLLGEAGGLARTVRAAETPNAGLGDTLNTSSRNIATGSLGRLTAITEDQVTGTGGRLFSEGSAAWDGGSPTGIAKGNEHPDFSQAGGLSAEQNANLIAFLNAEWARPDKVFAKVDKRADPVLYTLVDSADATRGETYYQNHCVTCHGAPAADSTAITNHLPGVGGFVAFLQQPGAPGKLMHRMHWGAPGTTMTRAAIGNPTASDIADVLAYLRAETPALAGDTTRGQQIVQNIGCTSCHGIHLYLLPFERVTNYMGTIDSQMSEFVFSDRQIADLKAYLTSLSAP